MKCSKRLFLFLVVPSLSLREISVVPRYLCPAGCMNSKAKVFGTFQYESVSTLLSRMDVYGLIGEIFTGW